MVLLKPFSSIFLFLFYGGQDSWVVLASMHTPPHIWFRLAQGNCGLWPLKGLGMKTSWHIYFMRWGPTLLILPSWDSNSINPCPTYLMSRLQESCFEILRSFYLHQNTTNLILSASKHYKSNWIWIYLLLVLVGNKCLCMFI